MPGKRSFPGRLTLEQWLETDGGTRMKLIARAQADLLGSFRHCTDKRCLRARACCSDDPMGCVRELRRWRRRRGQPESKTIWRAFARLRELQALRTMPTPAPPSRSVALRVATTRPTMPQQKT